MLAAHLHLQPTYPLDSHSHPGTPNDHLPNLPCLEPACRSLDRDSVACALPGGDLHTYHTIPYAID